MLFTLKEPFIKLNDFILMKCLLALHVLVQKEGVANCNGTYCLAAAKPSWLGVVSVSNMLKLCPVRRP